MSNETDQNHADKLNKPLSWWSIALIPVYITLLFILALFPIAQDWMWVEAWLFIISFVIIFTTSQALINKKNPRVIRNRMKLKKVGITNRTKKSAKSDWYIMPLISVGFFGAILVPPIDYRYNWSEIPFLTEMIGLAIMNLGLIIMVIAMVQNAFASKILDINKNQTLIDTGLYGHIRHPLYTGAIIMIIPLPIALGSWYGIIPAIIGSIALIIRIRFEERMLIEGMDGYEEYRNRVKYKLIPKVY